MNSPHSKDDGPRRVGDILPEVIDVSARTIHSDPASELTRRRVVAERMTEVLQQTRSDLIDMRQAGEEVDSADIAVLGTELQDAMVEREALRQQDPNYP